ncbi:unnamed protein product [Effrenium voratum]|uniref:Uncharacterized protein n=1 Tax=Effrenium voratum TaxID=2562239 RepID=A0AA36JGV8_9DINO|nr:unnamed protein product [Effrenium voratum]
MRSVAVVRRVRHANRCTTEGPLLTLMEGGPPSDVIRDVAAMDISRSVDDRQEPM